MKRSVMRSILDVFVRWPFRLSVYMVFWSFTGIMVLVAGLACLLEEAISHAMTPNAENSDESAKIADSDC